MPTIAEILLAPAPGEREVGEPLKFTPLHNGIKEALREDPDLPQGEWEFERKVADHAQAIKLLLEALAQSKDLELAVWLCGSALRKDGLPRFREALEALLGMARRYWDHLHPDDPEDPAYRDELRASRLAVLDSYAVPVRLAPLARGLGLLALREARGVPTREEAEFDDGKAAARREATEAGKPLPEDAERALAELGFAQVEQLGADVAAARAAVAELRALADERLGAEAPGLLGLDRALEEVEDFLRTLRKQKAQAEGVVEATADAGDAEPPAGGAQGAAGPGAASAGRPGGFVIASAADAAAAVAAAARVLHEADPASPASYLLVRGFRFGEVRAFGPHPDPTALEAPSPKDRTELRTLLLAERWDELLERAERVMATPAGRGWLDLQRYVVTALDALGPAYGPAAAAVRGAVRDLLAAVPSLPAQSLMDDLPAANPDTRAWLEAEGLLDGDAVAEDAAAPLPEVRRAVRGNASDRARAEVEAGRPDQAVRLLMQALADEPSPRGKFLRKLEIARILVLTDRAAVAKPMLDEALETIDGMRLEQWEAPETVAGALALCVRALKVLGNDYGQREALFTRLARLDPMAALDPDLA